jgi:hypothetical protein
MARRKKKFDITDVKVDLVDPKKAKKDPLKFEYPYWSNKDAKHIIVTIVHPDGRRHLASIMDKDGSNPDYQRIMEEFTIEQIDENTEEGLKRRNENVRRSMERREAEAARAKQEALFGSKLEAFEIAEIKNSKDTEYKKLIRRAKSPMEVSAFTTLLLDKERKQDPIVQAKMDALEIPEIKASRDKLKQRLHSAESVTEVLIISSIIMQKALDNGKA